VFPHRLAAIALLLNTLVVSTPVAATSFDLMFERVSDIPGGTELAFLRYDDREALLNNTPSGLDEFSPIDIAPIFSTTGLAYDGSQYIVMFERNDDIPGGTELAFLFYDDLAALLNNTPSGLDRFSPIDIAPIFSTTGLTSVWSGDPAPVPTPGSVPLLLVAAAALVAVTARSRAAAAPLTGGCALRRP